MSLGNTEVVKVTEHRKRKVGGDKSRESTGINPGDCRGTLTLFQMTWEQKRNLMYRRDSPLDTRWRPLVAVHGWRCGMQRLKMGNGR